MTDFDRLERKIDALSSQVDALAASARKSAELFEDAAPILKGVLCVATARLEKMEDQGYFAMGKGLLKILDRIVEEYDADDVEELGQNVVAIIDVIRSLTQPEVLALVAEISQVTENADQLEPLGLVGMARASRDEDAQRGVAVMVEIMRRLGQGVEKAARRESLRRLLGARRRKGHAPPLRLPRPSLRDVPRQPAEKVRAVSTPTSVIPKAVEPSAGQLAPGVTLTSEGYLQDWNTWTPEIAALMAQRIGVALTERHVALIEFARKEYGQSGASPNIRRLTTGSGLSTKELYQMFPKSPGKATAMIAGLPKPVGCI